MTALEVAIRYTLKLTTDTQNEDVGSEIGSNGSTWNRSQRASELPLYGILEGMVVGDRELQPWFQTIGKTNVALMLGNQRRTRIEKSV
jgi:hypothetical protein